MANGSQNSPAPKRKLIEVALPLETINRESAREKSIRHGHPSTLHLWWARRPLAAARAVLFAQLVDDPSAHPDRFPTEEDQRVERERLHAIIERLVVWENTRDQALLDEAHQEILKSTGGNPPPILDPFAGGGTIPLEAQRLGLEAHASDLNPVAVLINKALIEIPPKFAEQPPVFPGLASQRMTWEGASGIAADVAAYGEWMRDEAEQRIGANYPPATLPDGSRANVVAWIWARTVTCPNPVCGIEMPLVRSWWLGKMKGKEAWIRPVLEADKDHPSGMRVEFAIERGSGGPVGSEDGTVTRNGATCVACRSATPLDYVRAEGQSGRIGSTLMAIVASSGKGRVYLPASAEQRAAACVPPPGSAPTESLPEQALGFRVQNYGITRWSNLFTNRQLLALTTYSDLVTEAHERVLTDGGSKPYADAVATYLGLGVSRTADIGNSFALWSNARDQAVHLFGRQTISMVWDFPEAAPFGNAAGSFVVSLRSLAKSIAVTGGRRSEVRQADAATRGFAGLLVSTDPPYYDNIGYADLSDFFYVWLRRCLQPVYPDILGTVLTPKADELIADPFRHQGADGAKSFFESGFRRVFAHARDTALEGFPITLYYAFKQATSGDDGATSSGWETLLDGMIQSGWAITATWPIRSERSGRMRDIGSNALASSIVLALRPRPDAASTTDRRGFIAALNHELPDALRKLQQGAIAPVDLPQAAIGPGMAVFSRYSRVIENDGTPMSVRSALARINEILDQVLNEQEGDYDGATRFAIAWYRQHGYQQGAFGVADGLARARNTSVDAVRREGIITSAASKVKLLAPSELPEDYDVLSDDRVGVWEVLHHLIARTEAGGIQAAGVFLAEVQARPDGAIDLDLVKELAFLLFHVAEENSWTQDALAFNNVATSWPEIIETSRHAPAEQQLGMSLEG